MIDGFESCGEERGRQGGDWRRDERLVILERWSEGIVASVDVRKELVEREDECYDGACVRRLDMDIPYCEKLFETRTGSDDLSKHMPTLSVFERFA